MYKIVEIDNVMQSWNIGSFQVSMLKTTYTNQESTSPSTYLEAISSLDVNYVEPGVTT